jgi:hypothetical protein
MSRPRRPVRTKSPGSLASEIADSIEYVAPVAILRLGWRPHELTTPRQFNTDLGSPPRACAETAYAPFSSGTAKATELE